MSEPSALDPASPATRTTLLDWLALQRGLALHPSRARRALSRGRGPRAALDAVPDRRRAAPAGSLPPAAALSALRRCGAVALPLTSPAYPPRLAALPDPSPLLLVRGDLAALSALGVAIVGARAPTVYGLRVARDLAAALARAGLVVVSGLARGIDAAAHRGALEAGGRSVGVLACGPDLVYPREHRGLADALARSGAVITELPPGTQPRPPYFPLRNRLISGLSLGVVVVEARERSGSLGTANHALEQGLDVFAVPGPVTSPTSVGPNRLLRDGAHVVLDAEDVLGVLRLGSAGRAQAAPHTRPKSHPIVALLEREPLSRDELARRLGRPPEALALELLELELDGRVAEDRDGRLRAVPAPGP